MNAMLLLLSSSACGTASGFRWSLLASPGLHRPCVGRGCSLQHHTSVIGDSRIRFCSGYLWKQSKKWDSRIHFRSGYLWKQSKKRMKVARVPKGDYDLCFSTTDALVFDWMKTSGRLCGSSSTTLAHRRCTPSSSSSAISSS